MENNNLILTTHFCDSHKIEVSFIESLQGHGLIELVCVEEKKFVSSDQLRDLEKMVHLHYELDINIEGIEAINHLLSKLHDMEKELILLRNKVDFHDR